MDNKKNIINSNTPDFFSKEMIITKKSLDEKKQHIKPIVGCILNVCEDRLNKNYRDNGYQMVFLAKNKKGYDNLSKLSSLGYTEGFYYVPRVDKELLLEAKQKGYGERQIAHMLGCMESQV